MSQPKDGGSAFPSLDKIGHLAKGMTLRDYFAAKAMQGMLINEFDSQSVISLSEASYQIADAMLKEREK